MRDGRPHILIIRLGAIGDVVNSLVLLRLLRRKWPDAWIGWVVHPLSAPLLRMQPELDEIFVLPNRGMLAGLRRLRRRWRRLGIDWVVDLSRILKSGLVALATGASRRVGFDRLRSKEGNWILSTECIPPGDFQEHVVYHYLDMARHLGALDEDRPEEEQVSWGLRVPDEAAERIAARLAEAGMVEAGPVLLNLGASRPAKTWPPARWAELARGLVEAGERVVLVGGPGDRGAATAVFEALGDGRPAELVDWVGTTDLVELAALIARARLVVSCDTGPMHLAVALGAPVVALFGPTNPRRCGPWGQGEHVVSLGLHCGPCGGKRCRKGTAECMAGISAERVLEACRIRLRTSRRSA